jgi:hypothetical protein
MAGKWTPPSGKQNPPFKGGQTTSCIGGAHDAGPMTTHDTAAAGSSQANAVARPPNGIKTK